MTYKTRKHQIAAFLRELELPPAYRRRVGRALRDAAWVGAMEERNRTIEILHSLGPGSAAEALICRQSVLAILGYEAPR